MFAQFERQHRERPNSVDRYHLVTTSEASKTVTQSLRVALDAFRQAPEKSFRQDQPKSAVQLIDRLIGVVCELQEEATGEQDASAARDVLKKCVVDCVDLDPGSSLEKATRLLLQSKRFGANSAVWSVMISDCLAHAKGRQTIRIGDVQVRYERFRLPADQPDMEPPEEIVKIAFSVNDASVGREVVLCRFPPDGAPFSDHVIMELFRFDEKCNERTAFKGDQCALLNGMTAQLLRRASSVMGLTRVIDLAPELLGDEDVTFFQINSDEDLEASPCAEAHRERLRSAFAANKTPTRCIRCGAAVFSETAQIVERGSWDDLLAGLCHLECLAPDDRVLGSIKNELLESHPELVNFDVQGWFSAARIGQIGFAGLEFAGQDNVVVSWSDQGRKLANAPFIVAIDLEDGSTLFATQRNRISRLTAAHADAFVELLESSVAQGETERLAYSSESWTFGDRSLLTKVLGARERILSITGARKVSYDATIAAEYDQPGHWYAPLAYLRVRETGEPVTIIGCVPLLRDPLALSNLLDNWRRAGMPIPEYEIACLLDDRAVDDFLRWAFDTGLGVVVDPVLTVGSTTGFSRRITFVPTPEISPS